jgi:hypothetical protein
MEGSIAERMPAFINAFDDECTECKCGRRVVSDGGLKADGKLDQTKYISVI